MDTNGTSLNLYHYGIYGEAEKTEESTLLPFGFAGHLRETKRSYYYAGAREYDATTGRFLSRDTLSYLKPEEPMGVNLYAYGNGNPLRYVDYNGHESIEEYLTQEEKAERYYRDVTIGDSNIPFIRFYTPEFYKHVGYTISHSEAVKDSMQFIRNFASVYGLDIISDYTKENFKPDGAEWWLKYVTAFASVGKINVGQMPNMDFSLVQDGFAVWTDNKYLDPQNNTKRDAHKVVNDTFTLSQFPKAITSITSFK